MAMKNIRISIAGKLVIGFGLLLLAVLLTSYFTYITLEKNLAANSRITKIYSPSASALHDLHFQITNSKMLIKNWVHIEEKDNTPDKIKLQELHNEIFPEIRGQLEYLVKEWNQEDRTAYYSIVLSIDSLFAMHNEVMQKLNNIDAYKDPMIMFEITPAVDENGFIIVLTDRIIQNLDKLRKKQEEIVSASNLRMENSFAEFEKQILQMSIILFIGIILIAFLTISSIVKPIKYIRGIILSMGKGILPNEEIKRGNDEIGEMAEALNVLVKGMKSTAEFSLEIGQGNLTSAFTPLSSEDNLGNSLIIMQKNLKRAADDENKRKAEDFQRNWTSQGLARFGELLRQSSADIKTLSFIIIKNIVQYLNANQGGLFIINDSEECVELVAAFAYDRKKIVQKTLKKNEGLIGRCIMENETIFLTDIPENYIEITSGLGDAPPRCLLLVPLVANEVIYGVIEIASFKVLEKYQINFIEKIGESIASTILNAKTNMNTARLLQESQEKSEKLAEQEEVMRQTMQQMQAKQTRMEEMHRKELLAMEEEYKQKIQVLQTTFTREKSELKEKIQKELNKGYYDN